MVKVRVESYDEHSDVYTLAAFWASTTEAANDPKFGHGAPDFNNIKVAAVALPDIIGEFGEPSELVGKVFTVRKLARPE